MSNRPVVKGPVDGNAFAIMGAVKQALKSAGQGDKIREYLGKAMSGDYNHLLTVSMEYADFDLRTDQERREDDDREPSWEDQDEEADEPEPTA